MKFAEGGFVIISIMSKKDQIIRKIMGQTTQIILIRKRNLKTVVLDENLRLTLHTSDWE